MGILARNGLKNFWQNSLLRDGGLLLSPQETRQLSKLLHDQNITSALTAPRPKRFTITFNAL